MLDVDKLFKNKFENWNPDDFNWKDDSYILAILGSDCFDVWWDPERFNWEDASHALARHISQHFKIWWDPNKFNWKHGSRELCENCSDYIDIWWDPYKIKKDLNHYQINKYIFENEKIDKKYKIQLKLMMR